MIQNKMVPTNNVVEQTGWNHDLEPCRRWLEADEIDTAEGTVWILRRKLLMKLEQTLILLLKMPQAHVRDRASRFVGMMQITINKVGGENVIGRR